MFFRVGLMTIVLGLTVVLHLASPTDLALPSAISHFAIIAATYALSLLYVALRRRVRDWDRFVDVQLAGDLLVTTALVHLSGGAQSGYTFMYPLSIIAAAIVRYRRGAIVIAVASAALFIGVSVLGWLGWLPIPIGQRIDPAELTFLQLVRHVTLNVGAMGGVALLAATLGEQLAKAGLSLQRQEARTLDLAALNQDIIRCLSSGLVTVGRDGKVLTLNDAAREILGVGPEAIGRSIGALIPELEPVLADLGDRESLRRLELTARRPGDDADLTLGISVSPLMSHRDEPLGRIVNFQDLTELRRMELQVKRGERLAAIGGLAAGIAHEIRNPLASISGSIELLRSVRELDGDNRQLMEIVLREVDRLNALVTEMLDYARPRPAMPGAVDLGSIVDETVRVFAQDRSSPGVAVRAEGVDTEVAIEADAAQLRQVIWNLLRNAAEASSAGGEIVVKLGGDERWAELHVEDTGVGIPPEDLERIFEPFFTSKTRGTGLGLATVHRIVTEHGGTVGIESQVGRGTRVTVRLPRSAAATGVSREESSSRAPA